MRGSVSLVFEDYDTPDITVLAAMTSLSPGRNPVPVRYPESSGRCELQHHTHRAGPSANRTAAGSRAAGVPNHASSPPERRGGGVEPCGVTGHGHPPDAAAGRNWPSSDALPTTWLTSADWDGCGSRNATRDARPAAEYSLCSIEETELAGN